MLHGRWRHIPFRNPATDAPPTPFYLRRGAQPVGWYVRPMPHMLRPSDSPQLSERSAYQARSEFCGAPHRQAPQAARSESAGTQVAGSPFLGLLSFGEAKESKSAVGPRPDFLPHHKHTAPTGNNKGPHPRLPPAGEGVQYPLTPTLSRKREREFRAQCLCNPARQLQDWRASSYTFKFPAAV